VRQGDKGAEITDRAETMIAIDGSKGEGGGQVLRTALTMSLATGRPFRIDNIRGGRPKPGLLRQHLTAVGAAAAVGGGRVEGGELGSRSLTFTPGSIAAGHYDFAVGTAGSATLVLQTVLIPLIFAGASSTLTLEGGTHNPWAPPFDFLDRVFLPAVNDIGGNVTSSLVAPGFYPAGGGRFTVSVKPAAALGRFTRLERGQIVKRTVKAITANLPDHIAEREVKTAIGLLNWTEDCGAIERPEGLNGPGNVLMIEIASEHASEIVTGFGEMRLLAEAVAERAAKEARRYLSAGVPVGSHLADQLLPVLALGSGGSFRTLPLSRHAQTNAEVIREFVDVDITVTREERDVVRVDVEKR
jgi:RNA 3'-terminal phosphate cyclase (ATP)